MSSEEKRLEVFRKLPLRAQLATIASSKANSVLNKNQNYIASLEQIHAECLAAATTEEKRSYQRASDILNS
ncbi:MAG: hypothetical protein Tsb0014_31090 [Pleurocapsa sp.]